MEKEDDIAIVKVVVLGLDNAGKTSILRSLKQEFSLLSGIKPTKSIERRNFMIFGQNFTFWDFGGQARYREMYLKSKDRYFSGINTLYYVIDVQDPLRIKESIDYFSEIMGIIDDSPSKTKIILLFHKWDPEIEGENGSEKYNLSKMEFLDNIYQHIPQEISASIFETTIFNPLSIIKAISKPMFSHENLHEKISGMIKNLVDTHDLLFGMVSLRNFIEVGSYFTENKVDETFKEAIMGFFDQFKDKIKFTPYFFLDCNVFQLCSTHFFMRGNRKEFPVYLIFGYKEKKDEKKAEMQEL